MVATQEKQNNNYNFSLFEPIKENLLLPTQKKEKKKKSNLGGLKLILVVVQM